MSSRKSPDPKADPAALRGRINQAIKAWHRALRPAQILSGPADLASAATTTFKTHQRISVILLPETEADVQSILRIATDFHIPTYPVSRGRNLGFGCRVPVQDGCALIDLHRMTQILSLSIDNACVSIEPGVSFSALHAYLKEHAPHLYLAAGGGPADGSVVGNTLERGEGAGPAGARAQQILSLDVTLASGESLRTGSARFGCAVPPSPNGLGPDPTGLFVQSNLGIVTAMTVALATRPRTVSALTGQIASGHALIHCADALVTLTRSRVIASNTAFLWNDRKHRTIFGTPHGSGTQVAADDGLWHLSVQNPEPTEHHAAATRSALREALGDCADPLTLVSRSAAQDLATRYGDPNGPNLRSLAAFTEDQKTSLGLRWVTAAVTATGASVLTASEICTLCCTSRSVDCHVAFVNASERRFHLFVAVLYDAKSGCAEDAAHQCQTALYEAFGQNNWPAYRLGIQSMHELSSVSVGFDKMLMRIKKLLDPHGILAPGRYTGAVSD